MSVVMRFFQWVAWVSGKDYFALNFVISGFLVFSGLAAWQERDVSYAVIPFALAAAATVFFIYKQTTQLRDTPCLRVEEVLSMDTEKDGLRNRVSGKVLLKETALGVVYLVKLSTYSDVGGYSWLTAIIESVRAVKVRAGGFDMSWEELCVPGSCRTPHGIVTFREVKP